MGLEKATQCVVAGDANADLLLQGVPIIEVGKEKTFPNFELVLGGSSAITAFNLAKLGTRVSFVGIVGRDAFGRFVEERLRSARIDLSGLRRHRKEKTGLTIWYGSPHQERAGMTSLGTIQMLQAGDIRKSLLGGNKTPPRRALFSSHSVTQGRSRIVSHS